MSGWRSGSAPPSTGSGGLEPASAVPNRRLGIPTVVAAGFVVCALLFAWVTTEMHRPPRRALPSPVRPAVVLVPIGEVPRGRVQDLPRDYGAEYGLSMTLVDGVGLPREAFDPARRQYVAQDLISAVVAARPDDVAAGRVVIGVTAADIYVRGVAWDWAYAQRQSGQFAVVSLARMPNGRYDNQARLFRKMLTRQIGFLCYGLPPSDNPYDVLDRDILGLDDLRRIFDHL